MVSCKCNVLTYEPSSNASIAGYKRPDDKVLIAATGQKKNKEVPDPRVFPAPLVLPEDDLSWEPEEDLQDVSEWRAMKTRNTVTRRRNVIYIAVPPIVEAEVEFVSAWTKPIDGSFDKSSAAEDERQEIIRPDIQAIADYVGAFYQGLPVKVLLQSFRFMSWEDTTSSKPKSKSRAKPSPTEPQYIGLNNSKECVRVETRPSKDGIFRRQLSLNDLIDAEMSMLPSDAYALMLLVDHDIYESPEDDFACGRAYGGSRIGVISTARYNPVLDFHQNVDRRHAWPASHCEKYVHECCAASDDKPKSKKTKSTASKRKGAVTTSTEDTGFPLREALDAYLKTISTATSEPDEPLTSLWLARVCRTVSHELGHCFGIAHCSSYACAMQSTASLAEDVRQPLYLCPIDLEKVLRATGATENDRDIALMAFCDKHKDSSLFLAYYAWIQAKIKLPQQKVNDAAEEEVIWISP